jgi:hypothetical protein
VSHRDLRDVQKISESLWCRTNTPSMAQNGDPPTSMV